MTKSFKGPTFKSLDDLAVNNATTLNLAPPVQLSAPAVSQASAPTPAHAPTPVSYTVADTLNYAAPHAPQSAPNDAIYLVENRQPFLAITFLTPLSGVYPPRPALHEAPEGGVNDSAYLGGLRMFAGNFAPQDTAFASGQILSIAQNTALFSLYGTYYGGNGSTTFALPDLDGRAVVGIGQGPGLTPRDLGEQYGWNTAEITKNVLPATAGGNGAFVDNSQATLATTYMIQVEGIFPSQNSITANNMSMLGLVVQFGGNFTPLGYLPCDGRLLSIAEYTALFALLGTTYGGDGENTFALPDLRGRTVVGTSNTYVLGETFGTESQVIQQSNMPTDMGGYGAPINNNQPSLALNYIIALQGIFPSRNGLSDADSETQFLGEIAITAVNFAPKGWAFCAGQLLSIAQNQALFSLLGTTYGGNGVTTFALPDLRGRTAIGAGDGVVLGEIGGVQSYSLSSSYMPPLALNGTAGVDNLFGGADADTINGYGGNDRLVGNAGSDGLDGGTGSDTLEGGFGNDTYTVDDTGDVVVEGLNQGNDMVQNYVSYTLPDNVENLWMLGSASISGTGNALNNLLLGNAGNNTLSGGAGDDTYYIQNAGDVVVELTGEGTDEVNSSVTYSLIGRAVERLVLINSDNIDATGNNLANTLTGNAGNNRIDGGSNTDTMSGGFGDDTYVVNNTGDVVIEQSGYGTDLVESSVNWTLGDHVENLSLTGADNIKGTGNALNNVILDNSGINTLTGGAGDDTYYINNTDDIVVEKASEGTDTVIAFATFALGSHIENLNLAGSANLDATGNNLANTIGGNYGNNRLDGGLNSDTMTGYLGDDTFVVNNGGDQVIEAANEGIDLVESSANHTLAANVENLLLTSSANLNGKGNSLGNVLTGNSGANRLEGLSGADRLDGGVGADTLEGGNGNDTFVVDDIADSVIEDAGSGTDLVEAGISYNLTANVENLTLTGSTAINGTGNDLNNLITGNDGINVLTGGAGDDTYVVHNVGDIIVELAGAGADTILSSVSWSLTGSQVENLTLTGSADINATGNGTVNVLNGNDGANILDGGNGADTMAGGLGNDTYYVQNSADKVIELAGGGDDVIFTSISFSLVGTIVETLTLTGSLQAVLYGNSNPNKLNGNDSNNILDSGAGNDRLDGGGGADTMIGGLGNDTFVVDSASDLITEAAGEGNDLVMSAISYNLTGKQLENLTLTGSADINATGNGTANILTGNSGNNVLDGANAADTMTGGAGDDTYYVQNVADSVIEVAGEGNDVIYSTVNYSLTGRVVETLVLTGVDHVTALGNANPNTLIGNVGNNTLNGRGGTDILTGGIGADIFLFETGSGVDTITDFSALENDSININAYTGGVANAGMVAQNGAHVVITLGGGNVITVQNTSQADVLAHIVW